MVNPHTEIAPGARQVRAEITAERERHNLTAGQALIIQGLSDAQINTVILLVAGDAFWDTYGAARKQAIDDFADEGKFGEADQLIEDDLEFDKAGGKKSADAIRGLAHNSPFSPKIMKAGGERLLAELSETIPTAITKLSSSSGVRLAKSPQFSHQFTVTVTGCTRAQAIRVMAERLCSDEDYGFDYELGYHINEVS